MIFSTQNQLDCFLIFLFCGIIFGLFLLIFNILFFRKNTKILIKNITNCIFSAIFLILFAILLNFFNFGKFSISLLLSFFLGYLWFIWLSSNLVVFLKNKCYNVFKSKQREPSNCKEKKELN